MRPLWINALTLAVGLMGCAHSSTESEREPNWVCGTPGEPEHERSVSSAAPPPAMLDAIVGNAHLTRPLAELLALSLLAPTETFKITEIARDERASHHVVSLRDAEPLHRHDTHDLLVVVLEGHGNMLLGETVQPIGQGSIVYIPRATVHSMRNGSEAPLTGYAMFFPPFDGKDRVPVTEPAP